MEAETHQGEESLVALVARAVRAAHAVHVVHAEAVEVEALINLYGAENETCTSMAHNA